VYNFLFKRKCQLQPQYSPRIITLGARICPVDHTVAYLSRGVIWEPSTLTNPLAVLLIYICDFKWVMIPAKLFVAWAGVRVFMALWYDHHSLKNGWETACKRLKVIKKNSREIQETKGERRKRDKRERNQKGGDRKMKTEEWIKNERSTERRENFKKWKWTESERKTKVRKVIGKRGNEQRKKTREKQGRKSNWER
jgi:hypothetical protein